MKSQVNISKSVARTFRVLELFRETRKPMTAAEIQQALAIPQPSARVLLKELVDIGYLAYTMPARAYFPTPRLCRLGEWLGSSCVVQEPLRRAVDVISREIAETTILSTATQGHVEVLHVCRADHALSLQVSAGMGGPLWRSAVGRTLLSQLTDRQIEEFMDSLEPRNAPRSRRQRGDITAQISAIRNRGYMAGYDILLKGVGSLCVPVRQPITEAALVLSVAGGKDRIKPREKLILRTIRAHLRQFYTQRQRV